MAERSRVPQYGFGVPRRACLFDLGRSRLSDVRNGIVDDAPIGQCKPPLVASRRTIVASKLIGILIVVLSL
jgi:hypothetical protein